MKSIELLVKEHNEIKKGLGYLESVKKLLPEEVISSDEDEQILKTFEDYEEREN